MQTLISGWYETGTEVVFSCGGSIFSSITAAASANDGAVIGVDVDQSYESKTVITSALKGITVDMNYSWLYGASFSASPELQTLANGWYEAGTQAIFACGGSMFASVAAAASANDGAVIGVDVDQSFESETVITSAMKGLSSSVVWALTKAHDGTWEEIGGVATSLGAAEDAVGLPVDTWSLTGWTVDEYQAMLDDIIAGKITIDDNYENLASTDSLNLNIVE